MSKLTEQNLLKKSRFLKYSFLASISVGVVMAMPFEGMASSVLSKSLEELEAHYKAIKEDDYIQRQRNRTKFFGKVGKRPPTRRRASAGGKTTGQNIYGFKPTEQTPQKLEASSPTVSTASNSFVTAPNTPPNTNPKAARKLLFSSEPQPSTPPLLPPRPIAPEIVNNISQIGKMIGGKLAEVTATIQSIVVKKNKKPFQSQQKQLASEQKSIQKLKSKAEKVVEEIKTLVAENTGKNKEKINKLEKELKNIDGLARKIAISANKVVSTQPQKGDPAATQPTLFQLQQREVNKAKENVLNKKIEAASEVKRDIAKNKNFINQRDQAQLEQNQQHIAAAKTKKQQQPEDKQRAEKEKKGKAQDIVNIREDIATVTKIDANIKEILLTSPTPPSTSTIPKQSSTTEQKEQESMLPEDGGYLIPSQVEKPPTFLKILPDEQAAQLKHHKGASLSQESLNLALQKVTSSKEDVEAEYHALRNQKREQNLDVNLDNDLKFTGLAKEHIDLEKKQSRLEQEVQPNIEGHTAYLFNESAYSFPNKPVFSRSPSVSSLNSLSSDEDYVGDIGEDHRYEAEDSCPTPDHLGSTRVNISDENSSETKLALLRTLQMAVMVKRQELEQLPSTRSGADQIAQQINKLKGEEEDIRNVLSGAKTDSSKFDQTFSMAKIEAKLKQYNEDFSNASKLASVGSISDLVGSKENLDEEFDKLAESKGLNNESASDISDTEEDEDILAQSLLQEMQEDTEVTDVSRQLSSLPALASSNEYELALSDGREKECLALGDGSEDEEETIEQLSDSEESTPETTAIDTVIPLKQEAMEEVKKNIETTAPTLNQGHKIIKNISNIISTRLDPAEVMATAIAAGDEEETRIKRGLWVRSMYGINNHRRVENINGYRGINKGATIGFDVEIDNNIVGIAYSNVHSVFKFKNNDKEIIDSHVVSIYGQKELPKDFALQALVSASKNFIKDKTTYSYGDNKIRSNVKHRNHSYNAEALLNYSYLLQNKLVITPNIGLRYGKSRDGVYNENGINVQEIVLTMKENNILSGIVGTKVKVPLKDALKFNNLGLTFQGAVEHNFKEKTQRINRVVKIFDNTFKQDYLIPKQPKTSYNLGTGIIGSIKNITISLDYNYYLNKHYRSHQGSVKLKVNL